MLSDDVRQKAAEKLNVLSTGAIISGLERRIDTVLSNLALAEKKLSEGTLARLEAAERAKLEAAATEALLKSELEDSLKIKTELFDTCKKLARQLQAAQRGLSEGEKEQEQAKLKDNEIQMLQAEKEALEAQVKQACSGHCSPQLGSHNSPENLQVQLALGSLDLEEFLAPPSAPREVRTPRRTAGSRLRASLRPQSASCAPSHPPSRPPHPHVFSRSRNCS